MKILICLLLPCLFSDVTGEIGEPVKQGRFFPVVFPFFGGGYRPPRPPPEPEKPRVPGCSCGKVDGQILPWRCLISISTPEGETSHCSGSIIDKSWVLTAAHCTNGSAEGILVTCGENAQNLNVQVDRVVQHAQFSIEEGNNVAVLHLATPLTFDKLTEPICIPWGGQGKDCEEDTKVLNTEWGLEDGGKVTFNVLTCMSTKKCRPIMTGVSLSENRMCAKEVKDIHKTCSMDSGGTIDYKAGNDRYYAIGITSLGVSCIRPGSPAVTVKLSKYLTWLGKETVGAQYCDP